MVTTLPSVIRLPGITKITKSCCLAGLPRVTTLRSVTKLSSVIRLPKVPRLPRVTRLPCVTRLPSVTRLPRRRLHEPGLIFNPGQYATGGYFFILFKSTRVEGDSSQPGSAIPTRADRYNMLEYCPGHAN